MNVSDRIWELVADAGVKHVFFLPGGGSMYLVDALIRQTRITPVSCLHEMSCGIAAEAYAQYAGFGVALVTSGPGATNIITPVTAAWIDSTPMLVISGQVATTQLAKPGQRQGGPQEAPIPDIVKPITKHVTTFTADSPNRIYGREGIDAIFHFLLKTAKEFPSGPTWLEVPTDVQAAEI
jgi:acetolactate synthase-1/2/3 large subunit